VVGLVLIFVAALQPAFLSNPLSSAHVTPLGAWSAIPAITAITAILFHVVLTKPLRFPHFAETLPLQFPTGVSHNIQ
jgi:uncharacterized membrane protein (DUF485 family)